MALGFGATKGTGTTDSINIGSLSWPSDWSMSFRMNANGWGGNGLGRIADDTTSAIVYLNSGVSRLVVNRLTSGTTGIWSVPVSLSTEYNVTITQSGTGAPVIELNGVDQTVTQNQAPSGTAVTTAATRYLGNNSGGTRNYDGVLAEIAFYGGILSATEKAAVANSFSPLCVGRILTNHYPLDGRSSTEPDWVGANPGTVTGALIQPHPRVIYPGRAQLILPAAAVGGATNESNFLLLGVS